MHQIMQDNKRRYEIRCALEEAGCLSRGYNDNGFTVALAKGKRQLVLKEAEKHGLRLKTECFFPLGSDRAPEGYNHDGNWWLIRLAFF